MQNITEVLHYGGKATDVVGLTGIPTGPTWHSSFFLGADTSGRDLAVRLLYGGRNSLEIGVVATLITMILATVLGTIAGYFRGPVDGLLTRFFELLWAYPALLLGIALGVSLQVGGLSLGLFTLQAGSLMVPAVIIGVVYIPYVGKPIRAQVVTLREREFIDAARQQGLGPIRIMVGRDPAQPRLDDHRLRPADPRQLDPPRGRPLVPGRRRAGPEPLVGHDDQRRYPPDPGGDPPDARPRHHARARRARDQRLRRRRARRPRPALAGEGRALMAAFIVRRTLSCVALLVAISILTFLIFFAMPNSDPALRLAGRTATRDADRRRAPHLGVRQAALRPVREIDGEDPQRQRDLLHPAAERRGADRPGSPADGVAGGRRRDHLVLLRRRVRRAFGGARRALARPRADDLLDDRRLDAGLLARGDRQLLPRLQGRDLPQLRLRQHHDESRSSGSTT